ncbi:MAG: DUF2493 domain-containing protein [Firmicutes bacterium]|nr:DUF2493 domain-containing protein [Bacillota bacterium]
MRVVVTGGRAFSDRSLVETALSSLPADTVIINGGCSGADALCSEVAEYLGMHVRTFPANWKRYGKKAGPIRNGQMLRGADLLLAFPGGKGTANCIMQARIKGIPVEYAADKRRLV